MRNPLYIASVDAYSGKSVTALSLGLHLRDAGYRVGYFRPLGSLPYTVGDTETDEDALFISSALHPEAPVEAVCPLLFRPELVERALRGDVADLPGKVKEAYAKVSAGREVMLVGGLGDLARGSLLGLSAPAVAELLDAKVLVLARYEADASVEEVLLARRLLGERLVGAIFNFAGPDQEEALKGPLGQYLTKRGIDVLGVIPKDELLGAVTVRDLVEHLPAKVLCCENALDKLIVHFVVGAMGVASAAKYFRQLADKAVITGGDRADIQLAALQTATTAVVLTGNIYPSSVIVSRAQQLGVPLLLAPHDTLATVARIEQIAGRIRTRESAKVERARSLFEKHVDIGRICAAIGIPDRSAGRKDK